MTIFLVGMPGSGKSEIGKRLSEKLQLPFFDTDDVISGIEGLTINEMFSNLGEDYFRQKEIELISNWKLTNVVVATGGGMPANPGLMDVLNLKGTTIWLKVSTDMLKQRLISSHPERPLVNHKSEKEIENYIKSTLKLRKPYYNNASIKVLNSDDQEVVIKKILRKLYS